MNTDDATLVKKIKTALYVESCEGGDGEIVWDTSESVAEEVESWERFAAAVLPIIREAQHMAALDWMEIASSQGARILAAQKIHSDDGSGQCVGCQDVDPGGYIPWPCRTILTLAGVAS